MGNESEPLKSSDCVVVIPAYQPTKKLTEMVMDLSESGYATLVVDDGSDRACLSIWQEIDSVAAVLHHAHNQGKGAALKTAFCHIRDNMPDIKCIITMDADGQHLMSDMQKVALCSLKNPGALVLGSRAFDQNVPLRSKLGNTITRFVFLCVARYKIQDTQTGLRAFDRSLLDYMLSTPGERYEYEMNVLLGCKENGISVLEVPIQTIYIDNNSSSHFNAVRDSAIVYKNILKHAFTPSHRKG